MYNYGFKPYVSVAKRRAKAEKKMKQLKKKGVEIHPIQIDGRKIAKTFWAKAWCDHMESYSDFENRLPRGRTYVRNGSVCHLSIQKGEVEAMVSGSSIYKVKIKVKKLPDKKWQKIQKESAGQIGSLIDLLAGKLSTGLMNVVCDPKEGLFPQPSEIEMKCNCPDWADMCKHIAAVLYGVGARLDDQPEHLFLLRSVNHEQLVDVSTAVTDITQTTGGAKRLAETDLSNVFGIDISSTAHAKTTKTKPKKSAKFPKKLTGYVLHKKRKSLKMTQAELAKFVGVSPSRISQWERNNTECFHPNNLSLEKLQEIW